MKLKSVASLGLVICMVMTTFGCSSERTAVVSGPPPDDSTTAATPTAIPTTEPTTEPTAAPTTEPTPGVDNAAFFFATALPRNPEDQIPVFDEPDGPPRTLADVNAFEARTEANPLYATTQHGNPLVLRVIESTGEWLRVQVPTRPNHSDVWVRSDDFELGHTDVWIEISLAPTARSEAGQMWAYKGGEQILETSIVSGRPDRETPRVTGWVDELTPGSEVGPAWGSWVVGLGTFSEAIGSYAGGLPAVAIHGTNQPELMGQRVSTSKVRVPNEVVDQLVALDGFVGAPVHIHDGPQIGPNDVPDFRTTSPAATTLWTPRAEQPVSAP